MTESEGVNRENKKKDYIPKLRPTEHSRPRPW